MAPAFFANIMGRDLIFRHRWIAPRGHPSHPLRIAFVPTPRHSRTHSASASYPLRVALVPTPRHPSKHSASRSYALRASLYLLRDRLVPTPRSPVIAPCRPHTQSALGSHPLPVALCVSFSAILLTPYNPRTCSAPSPHRPRSSTPCSPIPLHHLRPSLSSAVHSYLLRFIPIFCGSFLSSAVHPFLPVHPLPGIP